MCIMPGRAAPTEGAPRGTGILSLSRMCYITGEIEGFWGRDG